MQYLLMLQQFKDIKDNKKVKDKIIIIMVVNIVVIQQNKKI